MVFPLRCGQRGNHPIVLLGFLQDRLCCVLRLNNISSLVRFQVSFVTIVITQHETIDYISSDFCLVEEKIGKEDMRNYAECMIVLVFTLAYTDCKLFRWKLIMELVGQTLGRYKILEKLGSGGMAIVYKALDSRLDRLVAVKIILPGKEQSDVSLKRFEREAKALGQLSHPNIVGVIDYGHHMGSPYLVMEYIPQGTLRNVLVEGTMNWRDAVRLLLPVAKALAYAHEKKIIHRDVKPSNILMTQSGEPMLSDFGIAKLLETEETTELTGTGVGIGTPEYMAPEQGLGHADNRSDIYAMGVILYEMITGHRPYEGETPMAVMLKKNVDPLPHPKKYIPNIPVTVEQVLIRSIARDPANRYQSMEEFSRVLQLLGDSTNTKTANLPGRKLDWRVASLAGGEHPTRSVTAWLPWLIGFGFIFCGISLSSFFVMQQLNPLGFIEGGQSTVVPTGIMVDPNNDSPSDVPESTKVISPTSAPNTPTPVGEPPLRIAYVIGNADREGAIYLTDSTGRNRNLMISNECNNSVPTWSPDGSSLLYQTNCGGSYDIWQINLNNARQEFLLGNSAFDEREAHYSFSGNQIVYVRHTAGANYNTNGDIRIYEIGGSDRSTGLQGRGPVFSRDDTHIAYMRLEGKTWQIFVYDLLSGENEQLTSSSSDCRWPAWSPDSTMIAYNSATGQGANPTGIWKILVNGGSPTPIIQNGSYGRPHWSESDWIVFNSGDGLWVIRPDGAGLKQLTSDSGWAGVWSK